MIGRLTRYRTPPEAVEALFAEIVAVARARSPWPVEATNRRAEFFFVDTSSGDGVSLVLGDDPTVVPVIELAREASGDPDEFEVQLLQVGGPKDSGVVDALYGRLVRCDPDSGGDMSFNGDVVPASQDVWARGLLAAPDGRLLAFAVGTDRAALEHSLEKFSARCEHIEDFDEVAYHFFVHGTESSLRRDSEERGSSG